MNQRSDLTDGCLLSGSPATHCTALLRPYRHLSWDGRCHGHGPTLFLPVMPQSACHCSRNIWNCFSASLLFLYGTFGSQHRIASLTLSTLTDPTELHELLFMLLDAGRSAKGKGNACEDGLQGHEGNVFRSSYRTS